MVQEAQGLHQARQQQGVQHLGGQQLPRPQPARGLVRRQHGQGLVDQVAQAGLLEPLGRGVDGGQARLWGLFRRSGQDPVFRMNHLQRGEPGPHLAEAAQARPRDEGRGLGAAKMEKAQLEGTGLVRQRDLEGPALAITDAGLAHLALDQGLLTRQERTQRPPPGTILITQGQVEQQIQHRCQPQPRQAFGEPGTHAPQAGDRLGFQRLGLSLHEGGDGLDSGPGQRRQGHGWPGQSLGSPAPSRPDRRAASEVPP